MHAKGNASQVLRFLTCDVGRATAFRAGIMTELCARRPYTFRAKDWCLELGARTAVMGILNVTPDSFSDRGTYFTPEAALDRAWQIAEEGADILDIGGESTRPGSRGVSVEEELRRVLPTLEGTLAKLGLRAMFAGALASWLTASIAGVLI